MKNWRKQQKNRLLPKSVEERHRRTKQINGVVHHLCKKCGKWKPFIKFRKQRKNSKSRRYTCYECEDKSFNLKVKSDESNRRPKRVTGGKRSRKSACDNRYTSTKPRKNEGKRGKTGVEGGNVSRGPEKRQVSYTCIECEEIKHKSELELVYRSKLGLCKNCSSRIRIEETNREKEVAEFYGENG